MSTEATRKRAREWARKARKDPEFRERQRRSHRKYRAGLTPKQREEQLATARAWKAKNKERVAEYTKEWRLKNAEHLKEYNKEAAKKIDPAVKAARDKAYRKRHKKRLAEKRRSPEAKARRNKRERERCKTDHAYRLGKRLRFLLWQALKLQGVKKTNSINDFVGCSLQELKCHIEKQFKPGMSWELRNFHIDHIRPCASFDLSDVEQQRQCFHFTNLQPLWPLENIAKGDRWPLAEDLASE
jgi:hypothetical protein